MRSDYRPDSVSLVSTDCVRGKSVTERSVVRARCSYTLCSTVQRPSHGSGSGNAHYHLCESSLVLLLALVCTIIILSTVFTLLSGTFFLDVRSSHLVLLTYFRLVVFSPQQFHNTSFSSVFYDFSDSTVFFVLTLTCLPSLTIFNLPLTNPLLSLLLTNLPYCAVVYPSSYYQSFLCLLIEVFIFFSFRVLHDF